jgi:hypothetical protein
VIRKSVVGVDTPHQKIDLSAIYLGLKERLLLNAAAVGHIDEPSPGWPGEGWLG